MAGFQFTELRSFQWKQFTQLKELLMSIANNANYDGSILHPHLPYYNYLTPDFPQVILERSDGFFKAFEPKEDSEDVLGDPQKIKSNELYKLLKEVVEKIAEPGDTVRWIGHAIAGRYDKLRLGHIHGFGGFGASASTLRSFSRHDKNEHSEGGNAVQLGERNFVSHCSLINTPAEANEDGALVGWTLDSKDEVYAHFYKVDLFGQDWTFYTWGEAFNHRTLVFEDGNVHFARQGISQLASGATKCRYEIRRTKFFGNANYSKSIGATSNMKNPPDFADGGVLGGIVFRAGTLEFEDLEFHLVGQQESYTARFGCPRMTAITDHFYSAASKATVFKGKNFRNTMEATAITAIAHDFDLRSTAVPIALDNSEQVTAAVTEGKRLTSEANLKAQQLFKDGMGGSGPGGAITFWKP